MNDNISVDYSIVVPVFCNQGSLEKLCRILKEEVILKNKPASGEIIFVDDGSTDKSLEELLAIREKNPSLVRVIKFTRNFGQVAAILAGYECARGRCVINISADLQDPPELISEMLKSHREEGCQIVACTRMGRDESWFRRATSAIFYRMMKKLAFRNMPIGGFDFILISERVKNIVLEEHDRNPFLQGQILWTGFKPRFIEYKRRKRENGRSKWTFAKKVTYLLDGVLGYSYSPLRFISITGMLLAIAGFSYAIVVFVMRIFGNIPVKGWAPLMIMILVLSGIQMLMLGVIGEYLWRTLSQTRNRKLFVIEKIY